MLNQFSRTELLFGSEAMQKLHDAHVAIFGIGGVGGYTVEALARSGIGTFDLIDDDDVAITNLNRQIIATTETIGKPKVQVMAERIYSINPDAVVNIHQCFSYLKIKNNLILHNMIMLLTPLIRLPQKLLLLWQPKKYNTPVISSMGAGNKVNPSMFEVADIYKTSVDPLARVMRQAMKNVV